MFRLRDDPDNDDLQQREAEERQAFEKWHEEANKHDVVDKLSAERAWMVRAGVW